jgi:hypothetical protein
MIHVVLYALPKLNNPEEEMVKILVRIGGINLKPAIQTRGA